MFIILTISVIIVIVVLILAVLTTSKAYTVKHTVDPLENNPHLHQPNQSLNDTTVNDQNHETMNNK